MQVKNAKTAGLIIIGDEILKGKTTDTNSLFAARRLREIGTWRHCHGENERATLCESVQWSGLLTTCLMCVRCVVVMAGLQVKRIAVLSDEHDDIVAEVREQVHK